MPPQPFVDLARVDLQKIAFSKDDIRKILPHRDHMALLDGIVMADSAAGLIIGFKDARADEFWTSGHFPGNPILPGVVQVEAAGQLAVFFYKLNCPEIADRLVVFGGVDHVRFRGTVRPGDRLWLIGQKVEMNRRVAKCSVQGLVNDRIVFEGIVIGIPV